MSTEPQTFSDLQLSAPLLKAIQDLNFVTPSPIQQQTIPWMLQQKDMIALAQTGTGKTAAFGLPILQNLQADVMKPQALIIAPTRELAIQVGGHLESLAVYMPSVRVTVLCGGQDYRPQLKKLREGAQIVVGTPGRILDHIERATLNLSQLRTFVLDEADEMLRMGFIDDVESILAKLPETRQIALFSATMPPPIRQIATRYLNEPVYVDIKMPTATVKLIEQRFLFASQVQKPDALLRVLAVEDYQGVIIFVRTKSSTEDVAESLIRQGYRAMAIHGDITQALRERIISQFKQGSIDILVATDVAARGLDVDRVTHVINYDMAHDCETYVHRIGRTGRAGRSGTTILFVTPKESRVLNLLERHTREPITKIGVPTDQMIQEAKNVRFMQKIKDRMEHGALDNYKQLIATYLQENEHAAEDIAAVLALMLNQDKPWRVDLPPMKTERLAPDFGSRAGSSVKKARPTLRFDRDSRTTPARDSVKRPFSTEDALHTLLYRVDVGRVHGVKPGNIVGAIANEAGLQSRQITGLQIHDDYSTVRLPKDIDISMLRALTKAWVCGRQLNLKSV